MSAMFAFFVWSSPRAFSISLKYKHTFISIGVLCDDEENKCENMANKLQVKMVRYIVQPMGNGY